MPQLTDSKVSKQGLWNAGSKVASSDLNRLSNADPLQFESVLRTVKQEEGIMRAHLQNEVALICLRRRIQISEMSRIFSKNTSPCFSVFQSVTENVNKNCCIQTIQGGMTRAIGKNGCASNKLSKRLSQSTPWHKTNTCRITF